MHGSEKDYKQKRVNEPYPTRTDNLLETPEAGIKCATIAPMARTYDASPICEYEVGQWVLPRDVTLPILAKAS